MKSANTSQEARSTSPITTLDHHSQDSTSQTEPITNEEIPNTPFRLIHLPNSGWFITLGINRIGQVHQNKKDALAELNTHDWQLLCNVIVTLIEQVLPIIQNKNNNK